MQVHVVHCHLDNQLYAMKAMNKQKAARYNQVGDCPAKADIQALQLPAERRLHQMASEQHCAPAPALFAAFQTQSTLYLVIELASAGSLAEQVEARPKGVTEPEVRYWTRQLVDAISWVHAQGFVHR